MCVCVCLFACVLCLWAFCVCACGVPHPFVDVHLILEIIRCSERYYEPGKFHGRGEYGAHATCKQCMYIRMHAYVFM